MTQLILCVVAAYLLGSLNGSLLLGRLRGIDIRTQGSGNAGGTNALRTQGAVFALGVIVIDVGKAWVAVKELPQLLLEEPTYALSWYAVASALAVVVGHVYPIFHGFRGGKGVATVLGSLLALSAPLLLAMFGTWLVMMVLFGFVGLGSMVAASSVPLWVLFGASRGWVDEEAVVPLFTFGVVCAAFVIWTHRSNLARMRAGTEPRVRKLWLLGRLRERR